MGFDVKRIFRIASDKHGRRDQQTAAAAATATDTDSPSEEDVFSQRAHAGTTPHRTPPPSLWNAARGRDAREGPAPPQPEPASSARALRKKASRIGRGREPKESGGYFNSLAAGHASASNAEPKLDKMFSDLRNPSEDGKDALGVESTMGYLTSLGLSPESGAVFVALELVQAPSLGEITRSGFVDGWKTTGVNPTLADQAAYVAGLVRQFSEDPAYFKRVYRYTFAAGKEPDQRSMSLDNAIEFWRVLFASPGRPWRTAARDWTELWIAFLRDKWTRSVNRDMWNQTLEFAIKSAQDETLSFWNEDSAWPSVIDDFVAWCRANGHAAQAMDGLS